MSPTPDNKLTFAPSALTRKEDAVRLTADDFVASVPLGTWFEVIPAAETPVKPYFDVDVHTAQQDGAASGAGSVAADTKARCVAFLDEHFPERTAVNCCQRVKPGKVSFHFTLGGMRTTKPALLRRLKQLQSGQNNSPFDLAPYGTYQKWNAPNHAKQEGGGPAMRVQDGDAKANLVTHLDGGEAVCLWGWKPQQTMDAYPLTSAADGHALLATGGAAADTRCGKSARATRPTARRPT
jgi:hypothetical protein